MSIFICIAEFKSKKGCAQQLRDALNKLIDPSLREDGCIKYTLNLSDNDSDTMTMIEFFKSRRDFEYHTQQAYLQDFMKCVPELTESVSVYVCDSAIQL